MNLNETYKGFNTGPGAQTIAIEENGRETWLPHVQRHSPSGLQWGYGGSGPADTALSILYDCCGEEIAERFYQEFKWDKVANFGQEFEITEKEIKEWIEKKQEGDTNAK